MSGRVLLGVHPSVQGLVFDPDALSRAADQLGIVGPVRPLVEEGWQSFDDDVLTNAEIAITGWGSPAVDATSLAAMPKLQAVLHVGGSVREVTSPELWARGVRVVCAADVNNETVADFVTAYVLLGAKGALRAQEVMRSTGRVPGPFGAPGLRDLGVGLVSFGSIARKVAHRLSAHRSVVSAWDPFVTETDMAAAGVRSTARLDDVFAENSIVSIHTPLIPGKTEGLIGAQQLSLLKPDAILLNTSRGAIIDEPELAEFLESRRDVLAILDVTVQEPLPDSSPLHRLPNVILTGHSAGSVGRDNRWMGDLILGELQRFVDGVPLLGEVTPEEASLRA